MNTAKPELDLWIDRALALPMYAQICQRFKTAIELGNLNAGDRVPAVRALATELSLARGTVEMAYRILTDEGYLQVRGAAGTVVSPSLPRPAVLKPQAMAGPAHAAIVAHDAKAPKPLQMGLPVSSNCRFQSSGPCELTWPNVASQSDQMSWFQLIS